MRQNASAIGKGLIICVFTELSQCADGMNIITMAQRNTMLTLYFFKVGFIINFEQ